MPNIKTLVVNLYQEPHGWWAESADAPGFTAAAATSEELKQRVESGLRFHFGDEETHFVIMYVIGTQTISLGAALSGAARGAKIEPTREGHLSETGGVLAPTPMDKGPAEVQFART